MRAKESETTQIDLRTDRHVLFENRREFYPFHFRRDEALNPLWFAAIEIRL
jgi:hypothetical protein